jgi:hypothetical protein
MENFLHTLHILDPIRDDENAQLENMVSNHRQLVRYEKNRPELFRYAQNNNISKNNLCKKMRLRALNYI